MSGRHVPSESRGTILLYVHVETLPSAMAGSGFAANTCLGLAEAGNATLFCTGRGDAPNDAAALAAYGLVPHPLLDLKRVPFFGTLRFPLYAAILREALRLAGDGRLRAIVSRSPKALAFLSRLRRRLAGVPLLFEMHGRPPEAIEDVAKRRRAARRRVRELRLLEWIDGVVLVAEAQRSMLPERFARGGRVLVAPAGHRGFDGASAATPRLPGRVVYLGQLHEHKGIDVLVDAAPRLPEAMSLEVIGGPDRVEDLRRRAARPGGARVTVTGALPQGEAFARLRAAEIAVAPYLDVAYNLYLTPTKVYEYMAAGAAIVATDVPCERGLLRNGENALLVAPGRPGELAAAIARLHADPALRERLAARARDDVRERTWMARGRAIAEFADSL
jgi:glycosyltransferase involved in cell wall biosynthesis